MGKLIRITQQFLYKIKHDFVNAFAAQAALFILIYIFPLSLS